MSRRVQKSLLALLVVLIGATLFPKNAGPHYLGSKQQSLAVASDALYTVKKVVDGDTIDVEINGEAVRVRLIGLDTPEIVDPRKPVQCFAREASDEAKKILTGQSVRLETDSSQDTYDKYGRLLAYVFEPDGTNFNEFMIEEGYGHEYTYAVPYKYQKEFKAAEVRARTAQKGLWAPRACAEIK